MTKLRYIGILTALCLVASSSGCGKLTIPKRQTAQPQPTRGYVEYTVTPYPDAKYGEDVFKDKTLLAPNMDYYYDMDGDGQEEKLSYTVETSSDNEGVPRLYVNDMEIPWIGAGSSGGYGSLYLLDLDSKDSRLELHFDWKGLSDTAVLYNFVHYDRGVVSTVGNLARQKIWEGRGEISRIWGMDEAKNGRIRLWLDTPVYSETIGCYFAAVEFELKDGNLSEVEAESYEIRATDPQYTYQTRTAFVTTTTPGGTKLAFPVETDELLSIDRIALVEDAIYARAVNQNGQTGWFLTGESLFMKTPQWG